MAFRATHAASLPASTFVHHTLNINCIVLGDNPSQAFTTKLDGTNNVSVLKKAIKDEKKPAFDHVPADTLNILKVSLPEDDVLDATLQSFIPQNDPQNGVHHLSMPIRKLSEVFRVPARGHIHVIVERPLAGECQSVQIVV
jgi:Crinkler effector protein N-terminal domain